MRRTSGVPLMSELDNAPIVLGAALLAISANALISSVSSGEQGISVFLSKEKWENPFYQPNFQSDNGRRPSPQAARGAMGWEAERSRLYEELDIAIEAEDYERAGRLKQSIDMLPADRADDTSRAPD